MTNWEKEVREHVAYNPFDFVESCEPDCSPERHAYHQGQWDMAVRICKKYGVLPNPVDGDEIPDAALTAIREANKKQNELEKYHSRAQDEHIAELEKKLQVFENFAQVIKSMGED